MSQATQDLDQYNINIRKNSWYLSMCSIFTRLNLCTMSENLEIKGAGPDPLQSAVVAAWQLWVNPPEPWVVVACSPQSAAVDVTHHTGPLTDVSPGMLGWSVLCSGLLLGVRGVVHLASADSGVSSVSLQAAS